MARREAQSAFGDARLLLERLIREAVQPEVEQARQIVLQVQARVIRLAEEILNSVQQGAPVSPATHRAWNKAFREATEKYSGQVKLGPDGRSIEGHVGGLPFPQLDPNDPQVAVKIMWNYEYKPYVTDDSDARKSHFRIDAAGHAGGAVDAAGREEGASQDHGAEIRAGFRGQIPGHQRVSLRFLLVRFRRRRHLRPA